jgi:hypothetical protein
VIGETSCAVGGTEADQAAMVYLKLAKVWDTHAVNKRPVPR